MQYAVKGAFCRGLNEDSRVDFGELIFRAVCEPRETRQGGRYATPREPPRFISGVQSGATVNRSAICHAATTKLQIPTDNKASKHHRADATRLSSPKSRRSPVRSRAHNARRASSVSWGVLQSSAFPFIVPQRACLVDRWRTCGKSSDLFLSP